MKSDFVMGYEMFGKEIKLGGAYGRVGDEAKFESAKEWCREVQGLVDQGGIRSHPVRIVEGGLGGVLDGLERLRRGEVRGEKLVVCLRDGVAGRH